jgi:two-component system NtrC family sensor kinase
VFEPFYTTKPEGTGLGLAVSHSLISQIGGSIKVKSQLGIGSTFSVYLKKTAQRPPDLLEHQ